MAGTDAGNQEKNKAQITRSSFNPWPAPNIGATPASAFASNTPWPTCKLHTPQACGGRVFPALPRSTPLRLTPRSTDLYWNRINPGLLSVVRTGDAIFCSIVRPVGASGRNKPHACAASGRCTGFDRPAFLPSHYLCSTWSNFWPLKRTWHDHCDNRIRPNIDSPDRRTP